MSATRILKRNLGMSGFLMRKGPRRIKSDLPENHRWFIAFGQGMIKYFDLRPRGKKGNLK